jgi:hypothetical protein
MINQETKVADGGRVSGGICGGLAREFERVRASERLAI